MIFFDTITLSNNKINGVFSMRKLLSSIVFLLTLSQAFATTLEEISKQSINTLASSLQSQLSQMMKSDPSGIKALNYCAYNAQNLTNEINATLANNIAVKRTALNIRNPLNAPNNTDIKIMKEFKDDIENKKLDSNTLSAKIETDEEYIYYKPLVIAPVCLKCHGNIDTMDSTIVQTLKENYPQDKATGYNLGDFRGVLVSIIRK